MYGIISAISLIIRNFCLPNPFVKLESGDGINWLVGLALYPITFLVVKLFYDRGSAPAWGSFLYLFFYLIHTYLIILCGVFDFSRVSITIISVLYISAIIGLKILKNRANI